MNSLQAEIIESDDADPIGYLISELESVVLHMAQEIDRLHARILQLESAAADATAAQQEPERKLG